MLGVVDCVWLAVTTADRMAAPPKSDRRRDDLCGGGLHKRVGASHRPAVG